MLSLVATAHFTSTGRSGMPPPRSSGLGATLVHSTKPSGVGSPLATPSVKGLAENAGAPQRLRVKKLPVVVSAEAERPRNKVRRLTVANRSTLRCAKASRHAAKRPGKNTPPGLAADVASPLLMTERSTRRTSLRRNLPGASSTYARNTARPGRQGVRSKIFATQKELDRRRPVGVKTGKARCEQMFSAPLESRPSNVPMAPNGYTP